MLMMLLSKAQFPVGFNCASEADLGLLQHPRWSALGLQLTALTIITKRSILGVAAALDPPLRLTS